MHKMNPHFRSPWPTSPWHLAISQVWNNDTAKALHLVRHLLWFIPHVAAQKQWTSAKHFASFWIACTQPPIWITFGQQTIYRIIPIYTQTLAPGPSPYPPLRPRAAAPAQWAKSGKGQLKTNKLTLIILDTFYAMTTATKATPVKATESIQSHPGIFSTSGRYPGKTSIYESMQYDAMRPSNPYTVSGCESWINHPPPGDRNWCLGIAICCAKDIEKHLQKSLFASWVCFIFFVVSICFSVSMSLSLSFFPSSV